MKNQSVSVQLFNDDCLNALKSIPDNSVDLIVSDVPYRIKTGGISSSDKTLKTSGIFARKKELLERNELKGKWIKDGNEYAGSGKLFQHNNIKFSDFVPELYRVLKDGTHCYLMVNNTNLYELLTEAIKAGFKEQNILVWKKNNSTPNKFYMKNCEFILMFRKGRARNINNMGSKTVIEINNIIGNKTHPTEKPVSLNQYLIENSSSEGETVLDPFMGSGSCGVASVLSGRNFIGIELDKKYFDIADKRIDEAKRK